MHDVECWHCLIIYNTARDYNSPFALLRPSLLAILLLACGGKGGRAKSAAAPVAAIAATLAAAAANAEAPEKHKVLEQAALTVVQACPA